MKWTNIKPVLVAIFCTLLFGLVMTIGNYFFGHSASDIIGTWQAQDSNGKNKIIKISKKKLVIDGHIVSNNQYLSGYRYQSKDNIIRDNRRIYYYGFSTKNNTSFSIAFPDKDKRIALLVASDNEDALKGKMIYVLNKNNQPNYQQYSSKYLK